jgi:DNA recombination protein RmuC
MTDLGIALLLLLVVAVFAAVGYRAGRAREGADRRAERAEWDAERTRLSSATARLEGQFEAQGRSLRHAQGELAQQQQVNREMDAAIAPVRTALQTLTERVGSADRARAASSAEIGERLGQMAQQFGAASADVRNEARRLSRVLSRSQNRGSWGEMQLRTLVESAGMVKHVHFEEQDHSRTEDGVMRPDLVVDLAGGRRAIVDAKVPLEAFLTADDDAAESELLARHAEAVATHITTLGSKEYWRRYNSPEFVILFLPAEGLLSAALSVRPELMQAALDRKVMLATPNTLMAMLHAVAHSWKQAEAAEQAIEIQRAGEELYRRVLTMATAVAAVGKSIAKSADSYNRLVGTLEGRVMPAGRRMSELAIAEAEIPALTALDPQIRPLDAGKWPHLHDAAAMIETGEPAMDPQTGDAAQSPRERSA